MTSSKQLDLPFRNHNPLTCQDCGQSKEDVRRTTCPFADEVYGDEVVITVCGECRHERADSI